MMGDGRRICFVNMQPSADDYNAKTRDHTISDCGECVNHRRYTATEVYIRQIKDLAFEKTNVNIITVQASL